MSRQVIYTKGAPAPIGPYSQAIMTNGILYVSGQIAINPATGELVVGNIKNETKQVFANLKAILLEASLDFSNVVKATVFLSDMNNYGAVNEVYEEFFGDSKPAREAVEVSKLPKSVNVEISVIAVS